MYRRIHIYIERERERTQKLGCGSRAEACDAARLSEAKGEGEGRCMSLNRVQGIVYSKAYSV